MKDKSLINRLELMAIYFLFFYELLTIFLVLYNDYCSDKDLIIKSHEKGRKLDRIKLEPEEYQLLL